MTFTIEDFHDLVRLLEQQPEWRAELRRLVLTDELLELPALVRQLAAQVQALAEAQARTEARIADLGEAQARTEKALTALAEAQARFEARLSSLERAFEGLRQEVGALSQVVGATVEESARDALGGALYRRGYRMIGRPGAVQLDGEGELDAVVQAEDPAGQRVWAIAEAKVRLREDDVRAWAQRFSTPSYRKLLARHGLPGPYLPYLFGLVLYFSFEPLAEEMEQGQLPRIGLLSGREELIPPPLLSGA